MHAWYLIHLIAFTFTILQYIYLDFYCLSYYLYYIQYKGTLKAFLANGGRMVHEFNYIKCSNFKFCIKFILLWAYLSFGEACASICGFLPTWHDGFLALMALGGIFIGVALCAEELFILGGEGFVHQWAFALETLETILMPVAVLVGQILQKTADRHLTLGRLIFGIQDRNSRKKHVQHGCTYSGVTANGLLAFLAGVGVQALITFHTVWVLLSRDILLPKQGLLAIVAVIALGHFDPRGPTWERGKEKKG